MGRRNFLKHLAFATSASSFLTDKHMKENTTPQPTDSQLPSIPCDHSETYGYNQVYDKCRRCGELVSGSSSIPEQGKEVLGAILNIASNPSLDNVSQMSEALKDIIAVVEESQLQPESIDSKEVLSAEAYSQLLRDKYKEAIKRRDERYAAGFLEGFDNGFKYASQFSQSSKEDNGDTMRQSYEDAQRRLDNGRHYLMGVQSEDLTVEDALEAFGYGRNGLGLPQPPTK